MLSDHEKTSPRLSLEVKDHSNNSPESRLFILWSLDPQGCVCVMMIELIEPQIMKIYDGIYFLFELTRPRTE